MTSLAEYNNNPGNIRPAKGVKYEGLLGTDDNGFGVFATPADGQQALVNDLTHKIEKRGIKTPNDFVDVYSPASKENTEESRDNYKIHLANQLGLKSTHEQFPEGAVPDLAKAVTSFESGAWNTPAATDETTPEAAGRTPALPSEGKPIATAKDATSDVTPNFFEIPRPIAAAAGAGLGAAAGAAAGVAKAKTDAGLTAYEWLTNKKKVDVGGETPGGKWGAKTGYGMGEGTVEESASRYKRATPQGKVSGKLAKTWGNALPGEDPQLVQRMIDRSKAADLAKLAQEAEIAGKGSPFWSYVRRLGSMPVKGALAGAGAGFGIADAYNRFNEGDKTGAAISGAGTLASMAAPFVASAGALPAAAVAAPLYLWGKDQLKQLKEHPEEFKRQEETQYDPMGNVIY